MGPGRSLDGCATLMGRFCDKAPESPPAEANGPTYAAVLRRARCSLNSARIDIASVGFPRWTLDHQLTTALSTEPPMLVRQRVEVQALPWRVNEERTERRREHQLPP